MHTIVLICWEVSGASFNRERWVHWTDTNSESKCRDHDFADGAHSEGTQALLPHFVEVGSQADAGKGQ